MRPGVERLSADSEATLVSARVHFESMIDELSRGIGQALKVPTSTFVPARQAQTTGLRRR